MIRIANCWTSARTARLLAVLVPVMLALAAPGAEAVHTAHVEAQIVPERDAISPGQPFPIALRLAMERGWHTYWQNPGDSGLPTTIAWKLPPGLTAGAIQWPAPRVLPAGPLVNYGYEGEVLLLADLVASRDLAIGDAVEIRARADWLVCRETCIPEGADLTLRVPVGPSAGGETRWATPMAAVRAALPRPLSGWRASADGTGSMITLRLESSSAAADPGTIRFFPFRADQIEPSGVQSAVRDGRMVAVTLPVASTLAGPLQRLAGVVTASNGQDAPGSLMRAAIIDVPVSGTVIAGKAVPPPALPTLNLAAAPTGETMGLLVAMSLALVGGLILNLMPCVFPILSFKVLGFATHHDSKATLHREAFAFGAGVVLTFVTLGLVLAGLRATGEELGWGFQLQSPAVVTALAMLFFILALNLSGVFEFGQLMPQSVAGWTSRNRIIDAFASGVIAVVVASPCTAPFMGAALGYALTGSTLTTLVVFMSLGVGMALPYTMLALFPAWRRQLPRSGPWLERLKQLLAFPLYGTVVWLAWVLGAQRDVDAVARLLLSLLGAGFALWTWRIVRTGGARPWGIAGIAVAIGAIFVAWPLLFADAGAPAASSRVPASPSRGEGDWQPFTPTSVSELTRAGRTVFVDFTAAWCVTCQVNKRLVLNSAAIHAAFTEKHVALIRADWTRRDDAITQALAALGRNGVPVYVLYRPGHPPLLLPEILRQQTVLDALAAL